MVKKLLHTLRVESHGAGGEIQTHDSRLPIQVDLTRNLQVFREQAGWTSFWFSFTGEGQDTLRGLSSRAFCARATVSHELLEG